VGSGIVVVVSGFPSRASPGDGSGSLHQTAITAMGSIPWEGMCLTAADIQEEVLKMVITQLSGKT
jgi:hypothetical protein